MSNFSQNFDKKNFDKKIFRTSSPIQTAQEDCDLARNLGLIIINERKFADEIEKLDSQVEHVEETNKRHLRRLKDIEIAVMRVKW